MHAASDSEVLQPSALMAVQDQLTARLFLKHTNSTAVWDMRCRQVSGQEGVEESKLVCLTLSCLLTF